MSMGMSTTGGLVGASASRRLSLRPVALAVAVAVVLADSSVVVLALPDVLADFSTSIARVAWVIVAFNLVLALTAVPAAWLARRSGARLVMLGGLVTLAAGSAACAAAGSIDLLIAMRCVQAIGAAGVVGAALELFVESLGDEIRAGRMWTISGAVGAALGPAVGGVLTQAFSWRAVFLVQVPVALALLAVVWGFGRTVRLRTRVDRPSVAFNASLALLSAALTAALFLLVLMLVDGWQMSPVAAALTVSVMAAAAIAAAPLAPRAGSPRIRAAAGCVLVAGGLAALAELPRGTAAWTVLPQVAIGVGLALALSALTEAAVAGRSPAAIHGAWTIAARHAGVVVGLLILTPVFTSDLTDQANKAQASGAAIVLNSKLPLLPKLRLGADLAHQVERTPNQVPDLRPAFRAQHPPADLRPEYRRVQAALAEEVRRAGTAAFSHAFEIAALIAVLGLVPLALARTRRTMPE